MTLMKLEAAAVNRVRRAALASLRLLAALGRLGLYWRL